MKTSTTKLRRLIRNGFINPDDFYSITLRENAIYLQGRYANATIVKYKDSFTWDINGSGYIIMKRSDIDITLT